MPFFDFASLVITRSKGCGLGTPNAAPPPPPRPPPAPPPVCAGSSCAIITDAVTRAKRKAGIVRIKSELLTGELRIIVTEDNEVEALRRNSKLKLTLKNY